MSNYGNVFPPGPLSYTGTNGVTYVLHTFPPTSRDVAFSVPTMWIDYSSKDAYVLTSVAAGVATWVQIGGVPGNLDEILIDGVTAITPTGGTVNFTSGTGITLDSTASDDVRFNITVPVTVPHGGTGATSLTGLVTGNGTSAMTASTVTNHSILAGGASNAVTSIAPSSTSGIPLVSQGASSNPAFSTATISGGGLGVTSWATPYGVVCGGTTSSGTAQQVASVGTSGQVLTSNGASALPSFQTLPSTAKASFMVTLSTTSVDCTGDGTTYVVPFDTVQTDTNSGFNTSTHIYTVPVAGNWVFGCNLWMEGFTTNHILGELTFRFNGSADWFGPIWAPYATAEKATGLVQNNGFIQLMSPMTVGQTMSVQIRVENTDKTVDVVGDGSGFRTYFWGYQL